jgi:hypothetical protein
LLSQVFHSCWGEFRDIIRISIAFENLSSNFDKILGGQQDHEEERETHDSKPPFSPEIGHSP